MELSPDRTPTVVFEAGGAANRSTWALVQPAVGEFAHAVVYDRAGLGRSPRDPVSRTIRRMADDLAALLDDLGPGPFVLVGHSAGGAIIRQAAADRPDRITGLVLVDVSDEASDLLLTSAARAVEKVAGVVSLALAHTPLMPRLYRWLGEALPAQARADLEREGFQPEVFRTLRAQSRTYLRELAAFRENPPELGDIPVTAVSGVLTGSGMNERIRASANASHAHRAQQSPSGRHVLARNSGHYVPITDPELVTAEIRRLVDGGRDVTGPTAP
ncbi:MAG: alpha/beta hydrolase [Pseudonocardia sp.]|nr:alpha/beta hydrolase [Pseudonocardia sp.]